MRTESARHAKVAVVTFLLGLLGLALSSCSRSPYPSAAEKRLCQDLGNHVTTVAAWTRTIYRDANAVNNDPTTLHSRPDQLSIDALGYIGAYKHLAGSYSIVAEVRFMDKDCSAEGALK
jgi:hypothetical protein